MWALGICSLLCGIAAPKPLHGTHAHMLTSMYSFFKKILFIYFEREGKGGRKRKRNIDPLPLVHTPTWDQTCNQAWALPDQESNQRPFTLQDDAQPPEPHWSGHLCGFLYIY